MTYLTKVDESQIESKECKFTVHIPRQDYGLDDAHLIKEVLHMKDGTKVPALKLLLNFKRPFYVTATSHRDHLQKKEMEFIDRLMKYECTESDLRKEVARALNKSWSRDSLRDLQSSPYIYGTDIESGVFIKYLYKQKYPNAFTASRVAGFDVETDIFDDVNKTILMGSMVFENKAMLAVTKKFLQNHLVNTRAVLDKCIERNLKGEFTPADVEFVIVENDLEVIRTCFNWIHPKMPDFVAIWNMDFDISRIEETCKRHGVPMSDVLCDPIVPKEYRYCRYKRGSTHKTTASGVYKTKAMEEQWHTLFLSASFYVIDPSAAFKQLRITAQKEGGYSLDYMLRKYVGKAKLTMNLGEGLAKKKWHMFMQDKHPIEYCIYNLYDSKGMLDFDEVTQDLKFSIYTAANYSPYHRFNSTPKKITDKYYFYCLDKRGMVLAALPPDVVEDETAEDLKADMLALERKNNEEQEAEEEYTEDGDIMSSKGTLGLSGWTLTLDPQVSVLGLKLAQDAPSLNTNIRFYSFDVDATGAYPTVTQIANVSKSTTKKELIAIEGIPKSIFRMQNLNYVLGQTNAIEYCTTMHKLPKPNEILDMID